MGKNNSMSPKGFIFEQILWMFILMIWYKNIMFRCIETCSLTESRWILWGFVVTSCIIGIAFDMKSNRNGLSIVCNLILGFGSYTVFTYMPIRKTFIVVTLCVVVALSAIFAGLVMFRKIKNKKKARRIIRRRIIRSLEGSKYMLGIGLAIIIFVSGAGTLFGSGIMISSEKPAAQENINEQTIANNIETVLLLQDELWETLTVQQRLDVLQTIANIEQRYLGLPNELNVGAANLKQGKIAYYTDLTHEIIISIDSLLYDSSWELLDSVCHEAYHSYQHRLVDAYNASDENTKSLRIFRKASSYANEFGNYINGDEDFSVYYSQDCENDARDYAVKAVEDYCTKINEYVEEKNS